MRYPQKYETTIAICKIHSAEGEPGIFINILDPIPSTHHKSGISDIDYVALISERWGKDTAFLLRENMELYSSDIDTG